MSNVIEAAHRFRRRPKLVKADPKPASRMVIRTKYTSEEDAVAAMVEPARGGDIHLTAYNRGKTDAQNHTDAATRLAWAKVGPRYVAIHHKSTGGDTATATGTRFHFFTVEERQ